MDSFGHTCKVNHRTALPFEPTVLYIEDDSDHVLFVDWVLKPRGFNLLWASEGRSGIEMFEIYKPDLVLLDMHLPDIDGRTVARHLRLRNSINHIFYVPIIAIMTDYSRRCAVDALLAGCDRVMSRPLNIRELCSHIAQVLPRSQASSPIYKHQIALHSLYQ